MGREAVQRAIGTAGVNDVLMVTKHLQ
jgi:hypothetical protein